MQKNYNPNGRASGNATMGGREKYLPEWMEGGIEGAAMHSVYRGSVCTGEGLVWNEAPPQRMSSTLRGTASAYAQY